MSLIALVFAVPASIGIALFITELVPGWIRKVTTFVMDHLAAMPSVVFGLWGVTVLASAAPGFYESIGSPLAAIPGLGPSTVHNGKSFLSAGFIVALMITPIITSITRDVFDTTPRGQKEAALALGLRWEMIRGAVLPHSRAGVIGAVLLGLGRAMGETVAVALVIGSGSQISAQLFSSGDALASRIANEFGEATGTWRSGLIGLGVVLFAMTILVNLAATSIVSRGTRKGPWDGRRHLRAERPAVPHPLVHLCGAAGPQHADHPPHLPGARIRAGPPRLRPLLRPVQGHRGDRWLLPHRGAARTGVRSHRRHRPGHRRHARRHGLRHPLRDAAYVLGTSKSRTIVTVVLPAALPGITSGALLAVARAASETAPLLFTIGASRQYNWSLSDLNTALSAQIFSNAQTGFPNAIDRAWGAALTLIVLVLLLSTIARVVAARFTVR